MESFIQAYGTLGFTPCFFDTSLVPGTEKIALFGIKQADPIVPTHAALQLETGRWTSKLGDFEDISHVSVEAVNGPIYGQVVCFLYRPRRTKSS
jgi:hypothetical protein